MTSFEFAFQPLGKKEKVREVTNEEESREIWGKRKSNKNSHIHPNLCKVDKVFEKFKDSNLTKTENIDNPLNKDEKLIRYPKKAKFEVLKETIPIPAKNVEIITDLDIVLLGTIYVILPPFKQMSFLGQGNLCNILGLPLTNPILCKITCTNSCNKEEIHLNELEPSLTFRIPGDGNCLFSSLSYIITGSTSHNHKIRKIITESIVRKLSQICLKFIQNKFPLTFRSTKEYISKSNMNMDKTWGGDIELFSIALLLNTDIWVSTTEMKNSWMVYSGKGASLMEIMSSPPANDAGSCYIQHAVNHYEQYWS